MEFAKLISISDRGVPTPSPVFPSASLTPETAFAVLATIVQEEAAAAAAADLHRTAVAAAIADVGHVCLSRTPFRNVFGRLRARCSGDVMREPIRRSGLFLDIWYQRRHIGTCSRKGALGYFVAHGLTAGHMPNPFFDPAWYNARYQSAADCEPALMHYIRVGARHGLAPGPLFDPVAYMMRYNDVADEPDLLAHFLRIGMPEGRSGILG